MKKEYDIVFSIGEDCACAGYLQTNNLRSFASPFDWLTNASFEKRFEMMLTEFDGFMDKTAFKFLPKNPNVFNDPKCDYYENTKTDFYYYHDFPIGVPFDEAFEGVSEKYNRRIRRFYEKIKNLDRVLLVWFSLYRNTPDDVVLKLCNQLCEKMGKRIDFLIIEHQDGCMKPIKRELSANITRYTLHTRALDEKDNITQGNAKLCNTIFQGYRLRISFRGRCLKIISKMLWLFVFSSQKRKELRKRLLSEAVD